jgi:hypothetical protein
MTLGPPTFWAVAGVYALARIWMFAGSTPLLNVDSRDYLNPGARLLSLAFFSGHKPWFVPFYWRLVGGNIAVGTWLQLAISIGCWLLLSMELRRSVTTTPLRVVAFALPLLVSLSPVIAQWDAVVLSESLTLSLAAAVVAMALRLARSGSARDGALLAIASLAWAGTRDTNVYLVAAMVPATAIVLALRGRRTLAASLAVTTLLIVGFSLWSSSSPRRWEIISLDLVDERVLGDPSALAYFKARGMPNPPGLRVHLFADRVPFSRFARDPVVAPFRRWLLAKSRATYLSYLISHPDASLRTPLSRVGQLNSAGGLNWYRPAGFRTVLPAPVERLAYLPGGGVALLWSLIACAIAAVAAAARLARSSWMIPVVLVLLTVPHAILVWDAEPREVARHALMVGVLDRVGLAMLVVLVGDALLSRRAYLSPRAFARVEATA